MRLLEAAGVAATLVLMLVGCGPDMPAKRTRHPVLKMAPFDLNCPYEQIEFIKIDEQTVGARGCGKQVKYVKLCRQVLRPWTYGLRDECRWVQN